MEIQEPSRTSNYQMTTMVQTVDILPRRRAPLRELVVGVDGGGTRTRAVVLNGARIMGEGVAGPSNPLRVGIANGATAIREAVDKACAAALIHRDDLVAAGVGLAGVRRKDIRTRMRDVLIETLGIKNIELVSDGDIALYGATDGQPGVVVISGTGSIAVGINRQGKRIYAGGWGPVAGDEGNLKSLLLHLQFANDGDRGFPEFFTGILQNLTRNFVARARSFDHKCAETSDPIICDRWRIDGGGQIVRRRNLKEFTRGFS